MEKRYLRKDGSTVWAYMSSTPVPSADGGPADYCVTQVLDISERRHFEAQLHYLADHDPLTGLHNRRRFEAELDAGRRGVARPATNAARCWCSTSTASRSSTTASVTPSATTSSLTSAGCCARACARATSSRGSVATSSRSSCATAAEPRRPRSPRRCWTRSAAAGSWSHPRRTARVTTSVGHRAVRAGAHRHRR